MKRAIYFVLLVATSLVTYSQNLIINPGFETWSKVDKPTGWTHNENCLKDSSVLNSGKYACIHTGGTTTTSDLGQTVQVSPGKKYTLSFYYRTAATSTGNGSRIWCYWKNSEGNSITDPTTDDILRPSKYIRSDSWQLFSISITSPANAVAFYLEVRTYSGSKVYWDDFVFSESVATGDEGILYSEPVLYPNPACDNLFIKNIKNLQYIYIQNLKGVTVWSSAFSGEDRVTIPVARLANGLYIIRIRSSDKTIIRKFIKN
jgi:hypothetical protein